LPNLYAKFVVKVSRVKSTVRFSRGTCYDPGTLMVMRPTDLTEPIDIYSEWMDAADYAAKEEERRAQRRPTASSSRVRPAGPPSVGSDEE
jgi:transcription elongation factor Elf1